MAEIIGGKFSHFENDDPDYPNLDGLTNTNVFVKPRPTKASIGNAATAQQKLAVQQEVDFKCSSI